MEKCKSKPNRMQRSQTMETPKKAIAFYHSELVLGCILNKFVNGDVARRPQTIGIGFFQIFVESSTCLRIRHLRSLIKMFATKINDLKIQVKMYE